MYHLKPEGEKQLVKKYCQGYKGRGWDSNQHYDGSASRRFSKCTRPSTFPAPFAYVQHLWYLLKIIVTSKTISITSSGELLIHHCGKRFSLNVVFETEVISHLNNNRLISGPNPFLCKFVQQGWVFYYVIIVLQLNSLYLFGEVFKPMSSEWTH